MFFISISVANRVFSTGYLLLLNVFIVLIIIKFIMDMGNNLCLFIHFYFIFFLCVVYVFCIYIYKSYNISFKAFGVVGNNSFYST